MKRSILLLLAIALVGCESSQQTQPVQPKLAQSAPTQATTPVDSCPVEVSNIEYLDHPTPRITVHNKSNREIRLVRLVYRATTINDNVQVGTVWFDVEYLSPNGTAVAAGSQAVPLNAFLHPAKISCHY